MMYYLIQNSDGKYQLFSYESGYSREESDAFKCITFIYEDKSVKHRLKRYPPVLAKVEAKYALQALMRMKDIIPEHFI